MGRRAHVRAFTASVWLLCSVTTFGGQEKRPVASESGTSSQASSPTTNPAPSGPRDTVSPEVRRAVDDAIKEQLKDAKVVDVETTQAIASRLAEWAKLFGFFVGIPLAVLAVTLGFLGFRTYSDFSTRVNTARDDALRRLDESRKEAERIGKDFEALRARLAEISWLASQVQELTQKVARIEDIVRFKASPALTPALKEQLTQTLKDYYTYLKSVGLSVTLRPPTVVIDAKDLNAFYMHPPKNEIVIHPELAKYPDAALREFTHHVLTSVKPDWNLALAGPDVLESGLADYLPSSFLERSDFGRDIWPVFERHSPGAQIPSRDLNNERRFSEIGRERRAPQVEGTVWGGAFWELRAALGRQIVDKLLLAAWKEFHVAELAGGPNAFPLELLRQDATLEGGKHSAKIREVFESRGLSLDEVDSPPSRRSRKGQ
jgi:HAMP domain-containing protein